MPDRIFRVSAGALNLRDEPDRTARILVVLAGGQAVARMDEVDHDGWWYVFADTPGDGLYIGYIAARHLSPVSAYVTGGTPAPDAPPDDEETEGPEPEPEPEIRPTDIPPPLAWAVPVEVFDFILGFEITSPDNYRARLQSPIWPGAESGLTIGVGYDLRHASFDTFRSDWVTLLPDGVIDELAAYCERAENNLAERERIVASLRHIQIPFEAAAVVFQDRTMPVYVDLTASTFPNTSELSDLCMGALVSLVFNRGGDLIGDRRREMRNIHDHMASRQFERIPQEIRSMKRIWEGQPGVAGLLRRRDEEAAFFERGLMIA